MRRSPGNAVSEFEELRRLLLSREREELRELRHQITDKERRSRDLAAVLPAAVKLSHERSDELAGALRPAVENSVRESIERRPETFVDVLHPIIGPIVRRAIAESLRRLLQSLNQTLEHTFSFRGLKWRLEAWRTGKTFAEVVKLRSLVYRVEQVFLIHRETSLALLHVSADPAIGKDFDMVAGMLSAIQDFARDSFQTSGDALDGFRIGKLHVWIAPGRYAYLAAVVRGTASRELLTTLEEAIESIHVLKGTALAQFAGDSSTFESVRPELQSCLVAQYSDRRGRWPVLAWIVLALLALLLGTAIYFSARSHARWTNFIRALGAQSGIVVTAADHHWFGKSEVDGLRDAAAVDPAALAQKSGFDPARIDFHWKNYLALDDSSVLRRFENRFGIPVGTKIALTNSVITISGAPPYEWLERVRHEATLVPGVNAVKDQGTKISYDRSLALARFENRFTLPDTVNAQVAHGVLAISGEASHRWLTRVRAEATTLPGITALDDRAMIDLDARTFHESKSIIENASVYFLTNKDDIAPEGYAALSLLPDELRRCQGAARRLGQEISLEIDGYADAIADDVQKTDLSQRRADRVRDFLLSCGFNSDMLLPVGKGKQELAPAAKPAPEGSDRRVGFKVISHSLGGR